MSTSNCIQKTREDTACANTARGNHRYRPSVDIIETKDEFVLTTEVPGVRAEDIDLTCEDGMLSLKASVTPRHTLHDHQYLVRERGVGDFERSFRIGNGIEPDRIRADLRQGILTLHLPKAESLKPRAIRVQGS